ncbi:ArsR/SmtB family transcription factor [Streptomyces sp. NPDC048172]|uniref:ArsR/SmtB family transcription factor n=1 Tax=Streptomyces sp. NPDC048172 TaxID=3365505 RepID=UPI0037182E7F
MLRIHFTPDDLARVRVAAEPDVMWELANGVQTLFRGDGAPVFGAWRRAVRPRLPSPAHPLRTLLPARGYSPDFLTPAPSADQHLFDAAVETVLGTPRARLCADMGRLARCRDTIGWFRGLAEGDPGTIGRLGAALRHFHEAALAAYWPTLRLHVEADVHERLQALLRGGTERLLKELGPDFRWRAPVLEVLSYPARQDLRLAGRGLTLQPSFFCWPGPVSLADPELPPVLTYPIRHEPAWAGESGRAAPARRARTAGPARAAHPLCALIGTTRAGILAELCRVARTTGALADRVGVSGPAVSQHLAVLRRAGLAHSFRAPGRTLHAATPEGRALVGPPAPPDR